MLYTQFRSVFLQDPAHLGLRVRNRVQGIELIAFLASDHEAEFKNLRIFEEGVERYIKALQNLQSVTLHIGMSSRAFLDYGEDIGNPEWESFLLKELSRIASIFKNVQSSNIENHGRSGGKLLQASQDRDLPYGLQGRVLGSSRYFRSGSRPSNA